MQFKLNNFIKLHNPEYCDILHMEQNKKAYTILKKKMDLLKIKVCLEHESIKKIYSEINDIIEDINISQSVRNILIYIGLVIMNKYTLKHFKKLVWNLIKTLDNSNITPIIKMKIKNIISSCIYISIKIEQMIKLEFKLKNRYIILNKLNKKWT